MCAYVVESVSPCRIRKHSRNNSRCFSIRQRFCASRLFPHTILTRFRRFVTCLCGTFNIAQISNKKKTSTQLSQISRLLKIIKNTICHTPQQTRIAFRLTKIRRCFVQILLRRLGRRQSSLIARVAVDNHLLWLRAVDNHLLWLMPWTIICHS